MKFKKKRIYIPCGMESLMECIHINDTLQALTYFVSSSYSLITAVFLAISYEFSKIFTIEKTVEQSLCQNFMLLLKIRVPTILNFTEIFLWFHATNNTPRWAWFCGYIPETYQQPNTDIVWHLPVWLFFAPEAKITTSRKMFWVNWALTRKDFMRDRSWRS